MPGMRAWEWNTEIDLVSFRCTRAICDRCLGAGWVETGSDPIAIADIILSPDGHAVGDLYGPRATPQS